MQFRSSHISAMDTRHREAFVNSLSGFKSTNLVGTANAEGHTNLAINGTHLVIGEVILADVPAIGVAKKALSLYPDLVKGKASGDITKLSQDTGTQMRIANAKNCIAEMTTVLQVNFDTMMAALCAEETITLEDRILYRYQAAPFSSAFWIFIRPGPMWLTIPLRLPGTSVLLRLELTTPIFMYKSSSTIICELYFALPGGIPLFCRIRLNSLPPPHRFLPMLALPWTIWERSWRGLGFAVKERYDKQATLV